MALDTQLTSEEVWAADLDDAIEVCYRRGWTDGLPVVPPSESRIMPALEYLRRDPQESLGRIPPKNGAATIEKVVINSIMGGCLPAHIPVVIAAVEAMLERPFNLNGVQATTHCVSPLAIVGGPIAKELGFNSGDGAFGGGSRANAAIGRAIRLILWNVGGAKPGEIDRATFGHPGKYAYCIAENADGNPWEPLHVEAGLRPEQDAVTVFGCEAPHSVMCGPGEGFVILSTISDCLATLGSNNMHHAGQALVLIGPHPASMLAREGWTKREMKEFIFQNARKPMSALRLGPQSLGITGGGVSWPKRRRWEGAEISRQLWPKWINENRPDALVPVFEKPEDIIMTVSGGWGATSPFAMVCPGWGRMGGLAQSKPVSRPE